jgi:hypothetical protein
VEKGKKNSIITSYNRNFAKRNDGNPGTHAFVASPELVRTAQPSTPPTTTLAAYTSHADVLTRPSGGVGCVTRQQGRNMAHAACVGDVVCVIDQVTATALAGDITFDPINDTISTPSGKPFKFDPPHGKELPPKGFDPGEDTFQVGVCVSTRTPSHLLTQCNTHKGSHPPCSNRW